MNSSTRLFAQTPSHNPHHSNPGWTQLMRVWSGFVFLLKRLWQTIIWSTLQWMIMLIGKVVVFFVALGLVGGLLSSYQGEDSSPAYYMITKPIVSINDARMIPIAPIVAQMSGSAVAGSAQSGSQATGSGVVNSGVSSSGVSLPKPSPRIQISKSGYVLIIDVKGVIMGQKPSQIEFWDLIEYQDVVFGSEIAEHIDNAVYDDEIIALMIRIDSPGGTIYGAKMISDAIARYQKETGNKVYAYIVGIGASGGYWVAAGTDAIYADMGTTVGSIGVITGPFKFYDQVVSEGDISAYSTDPERMGGIQTTFITAGEGKDEGNPYRRMTDRERAVHQKGVDNLYNVFVSHVQSGRNLSSEWIRKTIGAYLYDNITATEKKLTDGTRSSLEMLDQIALDAQMSVDRLGVLEINQEREGSLLEQALRSIATPTTYSASQICAQDSAGLILSSTAFSRYCR